MVIQGDVLVSDPTVGIMNEKTLNNYHKSKKLSAAHAQEDTKDATEVQLNKFFKY